MCMTPVPTSPLCPPTTYCATLYFRLYTLPACLTYTMHRARRAASRVPAGAGGPRGRLAASARRLRAHHRSCRELAAAFRCILAWGMVLRWPVAGFFAALHIGPTCSAPAIARKEALPMRTRQIPGRRPSARSTTRPTAHTNQNGVHTNDPAVWTRHRSR